MQTIDKAAQILRAFTPEHPEWGVRELALHVSLTRSSTHQYLQSLGANGFLRRSPTGRYRLSWKLLELSGLLHRSLGWLPPARQELARLADQTRSLAFLCVLELSGGNPVEGRVVCIDRSLGVPEADSQLVQTDVYLPPNATAAGKVLFAHANLKLLNFTPFTPGTITTQDEWDTELERVRQEGYAHAVEEWVPGQCALAAPLFFQGELVAAIGLQWPLDRYERERERLRQQLLQLTERLARLHRTMLR
ncbi:IclR family transcriptional regulator [Deinococcus peraridilitoris]|uniref:Transcriptional regulator n=1 Tax=Deinococcus peraridilitoris (strain DSM 19664 / LMG 22246 / CIP 109416 / KR-200) TaxID=937777 RepID=L0A785_DEIPD|nr:IclR family transcriptional regulator [Deinococcus peraridilitoris]AFZ69047.1 transcriptional regulator [Deinococcus peraridilitoris DSM 19664]